MNQSNAQNDEPVADSESSSKARQQKLAILGLFRLLETAIQTTQLKVAGQVVMPVQEIVGPVLAARSDFESTQDPAAAVQGLRQAAEAFRFKMVRWEAAARAAQAGQRPLTEAQKRHLPAEISSVRSTARKTQIFFDRLLTVLDAWARSLATDEEQDAGASVVDDEARMPQENEVRDGFTFMGGTETDEDGITLIFSLTSTKQFTIDAVDIREASTLELRFHNQSTETARLHVQLYDAKMEPILSRAEVLQLPPTQEETVTSLVVDAAGKISPTTNDTQVVTVEFIDVSEDVKISHVGFKRTEAEIDNA